MAATEPFSNRSRLRMSWVGSRFCHGSGNWFGPAPKFKNKPRLEGHMLACPSARLALVLFDEALDLARRFLLLHRVDLARVFFGPLQEGLAAALAVGALDVAPH